MNIYHPLIASSSANQTLLAERRQSNGFETEFIGANSACQ